MFDTADAPVVRETIATGTCAGHWNIESELGRGGMGVVYAVTHAEIGKRAALKVLHHELSNERNTERIMLEARIANRLAHPNIVDIFETGVLPDGRTYLVMERLEGVSLGARAREGRLLPTTVIEILLQLCNALHAAHTAGIVHRDLKPDNVFLIGDPMHPTAKLLDWGIAKVVTECRRTIEGTLVGTPHYLSPEGARGAEVTPMSDIYSLGVLAYELFLEHLPFDADNAAEVIAAHLREAPPTPSDIWPDIPSELETLLLAMMAKTPEERPTIAAITTTLEAVRAELARRIHVRTIVTGASVRTPVAHSPTAPMPTPVPHTPRWQVAVGASAFAVSLLLLGIGKVSDSSAAVTIDPKHVIASEPPPAPVAREPEVVPVAMPMPIVTPPKKQPHPSARAPVVPHRNATRIDPDGLLDSY